MRSRYGQVAFYLLVILVVILFSIIVAAEEKEKTFDLNFHDEPVISAVEVLHKVTGKNIVVGRALQLERITLFLKAVTFEKAMNAICKLIKAKVEYDKKDDIYYLKPKDPESQPAEEEKKTTVKVPVRFADADELARHLAGGTFPSVGPIEVTAIPRAGGYYSRLGELGILGPYGSGLSGFNRLGGNLRGFNRFSSGLMGPGGFGASGIWSGLGELNNLGGPLGGLINPWGSGWGGWQGWWRA